MGPLPQGRRILKSIILKSIDFFEKNNAQNFTLKTTFNHTNLHVVYGMHGIFPYYIGFLSHAHPPTRRPTLFRLRACTPLPFRHRSFRKKANQSVHGMQRYSRP